MEGKIMTSNGGVQFVPQIAVQYVYLDFDGELTDYNGEILTIEGVEVRDPQLTQTRIADILAELNKKYASQNVIFVTERPATAEYSTIFIGKTEAFDQYGSFAGLAETVDFNNQNRSDNAFVNLDSTATDEQIISTISHETDHLLGDFDHGGVGLEPYAYTVSTVTPISSLYRGPGSWIQSAGIGSDGICYIDVGGGSAYSTSIYAGGSMVVSNNGKVVDTTIYSGGILSVGILGSASNTIINSGGSMYVHAGAACAENIDIRYGGTLSLWYNNTLATILFNPWRGNIVVKGGAKVQYYDRDANVYLGNNILGVVSKYDSVNQLYVNSDLVAIVYSGGLSYKSFIENGSMLVSSGGMVNFTSVGFAGNMHVLYCGVASKTFVSDYASMNISSGGFAEKTTVEECGEMCISSGGVANSTTVNSGGYMYIESGGVANSTTVNSSGYMYISSGGTATSITALYGAGLHITVASDTYIQGTYNGSAFEMKDAKISGFTINSGVSVDISSGGVANSTTVNSWGSMYISSGGTATAIRENGGYVNVANGANVTFVSNTISGLTLSGGMTIHKNTVANSTTLSGGGMNISSGGVANSTTINDDGRMDIKSGGVTNSTTVNTYGYMDIYSGGVANSTTVNSGGYMSISSGGVHRGSLQINSEATVSAYSGAVIDFTLNDSSVSEGYLINDLSRIYGTPTFTITVSDSQESGTYKLAQGASSFTGSITIGTDTLDHGTLAVNGSAVENDTQSYRLVKTDGNLDLVVEDKPAALPDLRMAEYDVSSNSITTQESVKLTFKVYNDGDADTPASTIKVYDGDKLLREVALGEIAAGSYRNCYITLTAGKLSVGTHKVNVVLDSGNIIAESREDNNNSYRTIFVKAPAAQADLRMAEYDVSSNSITTQESVKLTFKVYNDGNADAPASTIKVYDGDRLLREVALGEIAAGGSRSCYITLTAGKLSVGTHKVNVVLDSGNAIAESREDNNNSYRTIFVKAATAQPDLRMAEYNVSSNNISTEESVKLTFKVYNDGDVKAAASTIKVYDGDKLLREVALGEIDAKGYRNCTITLTSGKLSVGTHKVNVVLDSGNLIAESNENNNNSYRTIFVKEPVRSLAAAPKENNSWDVCGTGSVDALCGENYADLNEWSLENSAALTRSAADILTTDKEESRLLNSGKLAG